MAGIRVHTPGSGEIGGSRLRRVVFASLALLSGLSCSAGVIAQGNASPGISAEEKAAAMKEGVVNYYTARATKTAFKIGEEATKALGITVKITRLSSSLNYNRAVQEFEQGVNNADVIDTSVVAHFYDMKKRGMLQPYVPANIALYRSNEYYDPEHYWHASQIGLGAINYNKDLVTGDMIPKTWKDLTDPKYKNKLVQGHIKASGTSAVVDYFLVQMYGWPFFEALKANNIMTQQSCDATNLIATGERVIGLCDHQITAPAQAQGLPIETVFPEDGVFGQLGPVALLAKAKHPNAGKLLIDWITSPKGQQHYVNGGVLSPLDSPEIKYPPQYPNPKQMKVMIPDPEKVKVWLEEGREKFGAMFGG
ncbi:MAG: extracellular solute-binding protein [Gammaproteobacteria bacterium]|nr:extracellular solute-binding protein [Gammaproteobacteria bacterium]